MKDTLVAPSPEQETPAAKAVVSRRALRDDVYDAVLEKILGGSAPAGSSLSIDALARELDVSPTPVREALVRLEHTGLVSRVALKGYRVAPSLSAEQMNELFDMRMVLETAAAERAARNAESIVPELRVAHAKHVLAADRVRGLRAESSARPSDYTDLRAYFEADWEFHLVILRAAGNRFLFQANESLHAHVQRLRQTVEHGRLDMHLALEEHTTILQAFETGDPEAIKEAVSSHLRAVSERVSADG